MKKIFLTTALICLTLCNSLTAESGCCNSLYVSTPCGTFEGYFTAFWLQPNASNLHYAAEVQPLPIVSPDWIIHDIDTKYNFGFDIGLIYYDHCQNTRSCLNWMHFDSTDMSTKLISTADMLGPFFELGPDASFYNFAAGKVTFQFDKVDLNYGLRVNFGDILSTNITAGISAVRIQESINTFYADPSFTILRTIDIPSTFQGIGPEFAMDFSCDVTPCILLTGGGSAGLLVGWLKNHTTFESVSPEMITLGITPPNTQTIQVDTRSGIIPVFETNLGLAYTKRYCGCSINVEIGYEIMLLLNPLQSVDISSQVITPVSTETVGVYARTFQRNISDFTLAGPYIRMGLCF